ncbi:hypothetical protein JCM11641_003404 [Rhodosporidiobolus odoratus]
MSSRSVRSSQMIGEHQYATNGINLGHAAFYLSRKFGEATQGFEGQQSVVVGAAAMAALFFQHDQRLAERLPEVQDLGKQAERVQFLMDEVNWHGDHKNHISFMYTPSHSELIDQARPDARRMLDAVMRSAGPVLQQDSPPSSLERKVSIPRYILETPPGRSGQPAVLYVSVAVATSASEARIWRENLIRLTATQSTDSPPTIVTLHLPTAPLHLIWLIEELYTHHAQLYKALTREVPPRAVSLTFALHALVVASKDTALGHPPLDRANVLALSDALHVHEDVYKWYNDSDSDGRMEALASALAVALMDPRSLDPDKADENDINRRQLEGSACENQANPVCPPSLSTKARR